MRREAFALLVVALSSLICALVWGEGLARDGGLPVWHIERRLTAAAASMPGQPDGSMEPVLPLPEIHVLPPEPKPIFPEAQAAPIRGVYATGYSAGSSKKLSQILSFIRRTEVNALVVDVKDDSGIISYPSDVPLAKETGASRAKFNPERLLAVLRQEGIYPIARLVAFKDPYLAAKRTDLAVRSKTGGLWRDRRGQLWVDPHNRAVWRYMVDIAKEAAAKGFREIQFDYVRFTSDGKIADCLYPFATGQSKADVIRDFLIFARKELKPLGVMISADVFGLTCSAQDDLGIGQRIEQIAAAVDLVCPMVYPSHYYKGTYGIPDPDLAPYETISASLRDALPRLTGLGVSLRPWLQDFSLRHRYGRSQLMAQIKAVYDAGLTEWIFWNPSNTYNTANYNPE